MEEAARTVRAGRYRLLSSLGGGALSETYAAIDQQLGSEVVVKRLSLRDAVSWKQVELAEREARVLASIEHPLLPRYLDHFEEGGALYTVMTRVAGEDLRAARRRGRRFDERDVRQLLRDAAEVFEYLHGRSPAIIHRDLKPSNVLLCPDGRFRFVDFGAVAASRQLDGGSTVVGTFGYMAPEQFQGRAGPGSDLYALGATAMALLTEREPEELPHRGLAIDVERALGDRVSAPLRRVLAALLVPDPDHRATNVRALLAEADRAAPRAPASGRDAKAASARTRAPAHRARAPGPARGMQSQVLRAVLLFVAALALGRFLTRHGMSGFNLLVLASVFLLWATRGGPFRRRQRARPPAPPRVSVPPRARVRVTSSAPDEEREAAGASQQQERARSARSGANDAEL